MSDIERFDKIPYFSVRRQGARLDLMVLKPGAKRRQCLVLNDLYWLLRDHGFDIDDIEFAFERLASELRLIMFHTEGRNE